MKFFIYTVVALMLIGLGGYGTWQFLAPPQETQKQTQHSPAVFEEQVVAGTRDDLKEDTQVPQEPQDTQDTQELETQPVSENPHDAVDAVSTETPATTTSVVSTPKEDSVQKKEETPVSEDSAKTIPEVQPIKLARPRAGDMYFGAFPDFGGPEDIVSTKRVHDFTQITKKPISWAYFSNNWIGGIVYPAKSIAAIRAAGTVPFVRLMPRSFIEQYEEEPIYSMQHIIDGMFDTQLRQWARQAKADPRPLLVDFAVEPNGDWFSWSGIFNGAGTRDEYGDPQYYDGPERYRDAYRHIIDLFREEGVTNVTWFFHADIYSNPEKKWNKAKYYYPGDAYIDWIGVSLYGPQNTGEDYWDTFSEILKEQAASIGEISSTKPIALLEFGVTDDHPLGDKATWIQDAFATILAKKYLPFDAVSYWHENWEDDPYRATIRVDSSPESQEMFQKMVADPHLQSTLRFSK